MVSTSEIKKGLCIRYNNDIYKVIEFLHVKPGKGPAFIRTKLKSVTSGRVIDNTFASGHKLDNVQVNTGRFQFLYKEGKTYHFMHAEDFNQIYVQENLIENAPFLKEGAFTQISIDSSDGTPLSVELPSSVVLEISEVEPGVKGNTATNATKPATLETGAQVSVPLFINQGDYIKVDTQKGVYIERIKK
ncbi:MAG: elongation factor P [Flavobacteriaceae bacterium]|nr:elongation factor P [Flavobacteriaceae bacterium]MCY4268517.1 elongation factor P [Flavobacteriaceae bacterium]MCY4299495.1 elongation factor P [Flavobacteriaceae bacterium]